MSLHDLFEDETRTILPSEPGRVADQAWRSGVRRRRRNRLGAVAGVLGLLLVALLVVPSLDRSTNQALPGSTELVPGQGIPSHIYATKPWLDTIGDGPIPAMAYIYDDDSALVISVDGSYHRLPNPRSNLSLDFGAISPGGRYLAYTWGVRGANPPQDLRPQIWVFDSQTGKSRLFAEGAGNDVWLTGLSWSPDATQLAWQEASPNGSDPGVVVVASLSGGVRQLPGLQGSIAWAPDGQRLLATQASGGAVITDLTGTVLVRLDVPTNTAFWPNSWSPDGRRVVGISCTPQQQPAGGVGSYQTNCLGDPLPVMQVARTDTGAATSSTLGYANMQVVGWREDAPLLGGPLDGESASGLLAFAVAPADVASGQRPNGEIVTMADESIGFQVTFQAPQDLLATAPIVNFPAPDQRLLSGTFVSWAWTECRVWILGSTTRMALVLALVLVLALALVLAARRRRRRRLSPVNN